MRSTVDKACLFNKAHVLASKTLYSILELFFNSNKVLNLYSRCLKYHTIIEKILECHKWVKSTFLFGDAVK